METNPLQAEHLIEGYLKGDLSGEDRARFEDLLAAQPGLREQVDLQRRVDASLGRLFAESDVKVALESPRAGSVVREWLRFAPLAAAAALLLVATTVILSIVRSGRESGPNPLRVAYEAQVEGGFRPEVVCTSPVEFAEWMRTYFGQPLYPSHADGVELVGWAYAPVVSSRSGVLLARVQGKPVVVVVDYAVRDKRPLSLPDSGGLHRFRAQIGSVVLYEVSPLETAAVLPLLSAAAPPDLKPATPQR